MICVHCGRPPNGLKNWPTYDAGAATPPRSTQDWFEDPKLANDWVGCPVALVRRMRRETAAAVRQRCAAVVAERRQQLESVVAERRQQLESVVAATEQLEACRGLLRVLEADIGALEVGDLAR